MTQQQCNRSWKCNPLNRSSRCDWGHSKFEVRLYGTGVQTMTPLTATPMSRHCHVKVLLLQNCPQFVFTFLGSSFYGATTSTAATTITVGNLCYDEFGIGGRDLLGHLRWSVEGVSGGDQRLQLVLLWMRVLPTKVLITKTSSNSSSSSITSFSTSFVFSVLPQITTSPGFDLAFVLNNNTDPLGALARQYFGLFTNATSPTFFPLSLSNLTPASEGAKHDTRRFPTPQVWWGRWVTWRRRWP
ncbi:hypothetical protein VIGAN_11138100 [Vigna angularis var. angularis]|uniref:Legume lectin domain-containing protein n=1 Tax=Vigna angularis var. angularis TaxID=157739 RepID=A0A0S3TAP8_PHAAN|nr:hypothetical protein VIGAN_11138100 [Vigna angularis var. angularis]